MARDQAIAFVLFAVAAAGTPGPSNVLLMATGANVGVVRGLPCLFGVGGGMGLMMFVVSFGLGSIVLANPAVLQVLHGLGAAFLLWLAWKIATAGRDDAAGARKPVGFLGAAGFQWVNPKSWLVCASAAGAYLTAGTGSALAQALSFGILFTVAALPCCFVWLAFGATAQRWLRGERARRMFNVVMGVLLAGSVVLIAF
jgi:threonine/homoserine/homoserine lactone efflux protein